MNTDEKQYEDRIEEANRAFSGALPRVVNDFIDAAVEVSHRITFLRGFVSLTF